MRAWRWFTSWRCKHEMVCYVGPHVYTPVCVKCGKCRTCGRIDSHVPTEDDA